MVVHIYYALSFQATNDRHWEADKQFLPIVKIAGQKVQISNIHDWRYSADKVLSQAYYDETFDSRDIKEVYFIHEPFGRLDNWIGHTFLMFAFNSGKKVVFSIEARKEEGEKYKFTPGVYRQYELMYMWGSEDDFIRRRLDYQKHRLYMYPLKMSQAKAGEFFRILGRESEWLRQHPRYYHTLASNCTNKIGDMANRVSPGLIPWWRPERVFTARSPRLLYRKGLIKRSEGLTFNKVQEKYKVTAETYKPRNLR